MRPITCYLGAQMLAKDLSRLLAQRAQDVAQTLLPNGKKKGNEWCVGSINGEPGDSLKVHLTGTKAGVWSDFQAGPTGDLLDLWAATRGITIVQAMKEVCDYYNIGENKYTPAAGVKKRLFKRPAPKTSEPLKKTSPVHQYLSIARGLDEAVISAYEIPHSDTDIVFNYFRGTELIFVKTLKLERKEGAKQIFVSPEAEPCLFGWNLISKNARKLAICEGEIDAMSLYQYGIAALSVPFGGGAGDKQRWIEYEHERLNQFDEIFLCMDNDVAGQEGAREIAQRLGRHRCRLVELPMKDANECLTNGMTAEDIHFFIENAKNLDPSELKDPKAFELQAIERLHPVPGKFLGYRLGWDKLADNILFRPTGLTMWTGYNGHGKTLFLGQVMLQMIEQGARVCVASMELDPSELMERCYVQATGMCAPAIPYIKKITEWLMGKLYIFDLVGTGDINHLLEVFTYARIRYGVDVFIIDSLTTLNIAEDDYNGQKELTGKLRDFKVKHQCHIHLVAHPRKPRDESVIPGKYDIRGAGAISDLADNCLSVWRNKVKEDLKRREAKGAILSPDDYEKLQKADTYLRCDKNRHGRGQYKEGLFSFWFDEPSYQYLEREDSKLRKFIEYSCLNES